MEEIQKYLLKQTILTILIFLFATTYIWSGSIAYFIQDGVAKIPNIMHANYATDSGFIFWTLAIIISFSFNCSFFKLNTIIIMFLAVLVHIFLSTEIAEVVPAHLTSNNALFVFKTLVNIIMLLGYVIALGVPVFKFLKQEDESERAVYPERNIILLQCFLAFWSSAFYDATGFQFPANIINLLWG